MDDNTVTNTEPKRTLKERLLNSPIVACIAGSIILFCSFGIRQTFGVFLIPVTKSTGWDRSTVSIAAGLFQLFWGLSQPFVVYFAERKWGFGKSIFFASLCYAAGLFILYASKNSSGLFIFAYAVIVGISAAGNSFPVILATIGRRFPQQSKQQAIAFGLVSSSGSLGQVVFLPIARVMVVAIDWQLSFVVLGKKIKMFSFGQKSFFFCNQPSILGSIMVVVLPLCFFLQSVPAKPPLPAATTEKIELLDDKNVVIQVEENNEIKPKESSTEDTFSAPDIKTALKEAFASPIYIMICLGFSVCGFHVSFLATHLPAYLVKLNKIK